MASGEKQMIKHGRTNTVEYETWIRMKQRCYNPNHSRYKDWGGRGITVCDRWLDFKNFFEDMGLRPSNKHSIDRIDNNKGYSPDNCRWATPLEQSSNTRRSHRTHCKYGHKVTKENMYIVPKTGATECRVCRNSQNLAWYHRNKATNMAIVWRES